MVQRVREHAGSGVRRARARGGAGQDAPEDQPRRRWLPRRRADRRGAGHGSRSAGLPGRARPRQAAEAGGPGEPDGEKTAGECARPSLWMIGRGADVTLMVF